MAVNSPTTRLKRRTGIFKLPSAARRTFNDVPYKRNAHLYERLSDDARRLPVQVRMRLQFTIGTIT